ncbi:MAG: sigma-70 family RNA polymerase sigma factor [Pseudomonadota bacterium]
MCNLDSELEAFIRERGDLIALAGSIVGNRHVAEEIVQESWLRWTAHDYPRDKTVPIVRRIVANLAKDWRRKERSERFWLSHYTLDADQAFDTERIVGAKQELLEVAAILNELPKRTQQAFALHRLSGLTYAQIGRRMKLSTTRVHQLVKDALVHVALRRTT